MVVALALLMLVAGQLAATLGYKRRVHQAWRTHEVTRYPDLAFPQHLNPEVARPGWRPVFPDYLYLGFTNATAFSPTDVMPLAH